MKTIFIKPAEVQRRWFLIDATDKVLGRVAAQVVTVLRGKNKPVYTPHQEVGDYVIVVNSSKMKVSGGKEFKKIYYHHTGHIGGIKGEVFQSLLKRRPIRPLELAIRGMLPHNRMGYKLFKNVKIYGNDRHPHAAQQPQPMEV
ncbi:MAG: 50S ribosomal protein L13 [Spirochaetales bacterium]|nr:50S ribosomal protein L13 [Spirochaetales bacterium]